MVKHQKRAHLQGIYVDNTIGGDESDPEKVVSPSMPHDSYVPWSLHVVPSHASLQSRRVSLQSAPLADVGQHQHAYSAQHAFGRRHSEISQPGAGIHEAPMINQHQGVQAMQSEPSVNQTPIYMSAQNSNDSSVDAVPRTYHHYNESAQHSQAEMRYSANATVIPDHTSPEDSSYSRHTSSSVASSFYDVSSGDEQQQHVVQYVPSQIGSSPHEMVFPQHQQTSPHVSLGGFQRMPAAPVPVTWCDYQPPMEVTTIGHLPAYGLGSYGFYFEPKFDLEDPSMQLPSARLETI